MSKAAELTSKIPSACELREALSENLRYTHDLRQLLKLAERRESRVPLSGDRRETAECRL